MNIFLAILAGLTIGYTLVLFVSAGFAVAIYGPMKWNDPDLIEYLLINKGKFEKNPFNYNLLSIRNDKRKLDWVSKNTALSFIELFSWCACKDINGKHKGFCVVKFSPLSKVLDEIHREAETPKFFTNWDNSNDSADYWKE